MMAALIFVVSVTTLLMCFVSYCRSLMASSSSHMLSREVREVTGIPALPSGEDFARVMQLLQLCPEQREDRTALQAVSMYFEILSFIQQTLSRVVPSVRAWADHERAGCANIAAVVLDRRIAFSRENLTEQGGF